MDRAGICQFLIDAFPDMPNDLCAEIARVCKNEEDAADRMQEMILGNSKENGKNVANKWKKPIPLPEPKNENVPLWWNEWWSQNYKNYKCTKDCAEAALFCTNEFKGMTLRDAGPWIEKRLKIYVPMKGNNGMKKRKVPKQQRGNYSKIY